MKMTYSPLALTSKHVQTLIDMDLEKSPILEISRDTFLVACATGFRWGEIARLSKGMLYEDGCLHLRHVDGGIVVLQLHQIAANVLRKYPLGLPEATLISHNRNLRLIGCLAGFDEERVVTTYLKGKRQSLIKPLHQLLSMHVTRRTYFSIIVRQH